MKIKKLSINILLTLLISLSFIGCGGSDDDSDSSPETPIVTSPTTGSNPEVVISNISPIANAGTDKTINTGDSVVFSASKSNDSDGTILSYKWEDGNTILSNSLSFSKSNLSVGVHSIVLTVTDNDGASATDTVVITVMAIEIQDENTKEIQF